MSSGNSQLSIFPNCPLCGGEQIHVGRVVEVYWLNGLEVLVRLCRHNEEKGKVYLSTFSLSMEEARHLASELERVLRE